MKIRFQADWDLNQHIVTGARRREPGIDFQTAASGGLWGLSDPDVLRQTANDGRLLVSHDRKTMPRHFGEFLNTSPSSSPGLLIIPQDVPIGEAIEEIILIWLCSEPPDWINRLDILRRQR